MENNSNPNFHKTLAFPKELRENIIHELGKLLKDRASLQQTLREQQSQEQMEKEKLFLELLEVVDALDFLLESIHLNPEHSPQLVQRLPRSISSIQKKLLNILHRRQVTPIEFEATQPDFEICKVVDREIRNDLEPQTITKIVRQGFQIDKKILRPVEVITSKLE